MVTSTLDMNATIDTPRPKTKTSITGNAQYATSSAERQAPSIPYIFTQPPLLVSI